MKQLLFIVLSFSLFLNEGFSQMQPKNANKNNIQREASDTTKKQLFLIRKTDGNELYGFIISDDGREILLETKTIGKVYINKSDIKEIINTKRSVSVDSIDDESYTEFRDSGPFTTRYYFTNNALPVKKGEDYAMIHLYGPEIHFSLNDKLSFGVMSTWIASPIALASKYSLYSDGNNHVALGTILGTSGYLGIADGGVFGGLHWLTFTKGDRLKNISFSAGYGYIFDNGYVLRNSDFFNTSLGQKYNTSGEYTLMPSVESQYIIFVRSGINHSLKLQLGPPNQHYPPNFGSFYQRKFQDALFLSLAGIVPIGKKASFIFDAMVVINQKQDVTYSDYDVNVNYIANPYGTATNNETFTIGKGELTNSGLSTTFIFMPGIRFNTSYEKAFQISLAGVITSTTDEIDVGSDIFSFPAPMISWLRKF